MALGDNYATLAEMKSRLGIETGDTVDDSRMSSAIASASREIERWCGRQFNDAGSTSTREYLANGAYIVITDDFHTTTPIVTDQDAVVIGPAGYALEPLNGVVRGVAGYPWWRIINRTTTNFPNPASPYFKTVLVTARWGWAAVPAPVHESCLILSEEIFKMRDAPFGVANWGEMGPIRVADNKRVQSMLRPYRRGMVRVA